MKLNTISSIDHFLYGTKDLEIGEHNNQVITLSAHRVNDNWVYVNKNSILKLIKEL